MGTIIYKGRSYAGSVGSNPNLLINGDFRNPVNQRGATSYTGSHAKMYTIDRWRITDGTVTVNDKSVTFANTYTSNAGMLQVLEYPMDISNSFTVTVKVKSLSGSAKIRANVGTTNYEEELVNGINVYTNKSESEKLNYVMILLTPNSSIELEYVKLEQGSIATPFIPRLYAEELALCQRYYEKIVCKGVTRLRYSDTRQLMFVDFPRKRIEPTVSIDSVSTYDSSGNKITTANGGITTTEISSAAVTCATIIVNANSAINANAYSHAVTLTLDAEIY